MVEWKRTTRRTNAVSSWGLDISEGRRAAEADEFDFDCPGVF